MHVTPAVRLVRPLGQGGMGKVWVAEHTGLKTEVVVKLLSRDVSDPDDALARFSREASVAAAVKSPHVCQVFDYGVTPEGQPYIVMELLEGRDLSDYLTKHGRMAPSDVAALVAQVAKGLGKAHQVGVIHRDIKPENIFLCDGEGGELFVKVLDFGIAKRDARIETSSTTTGQVVGTPYYMSPEQIVGEKELDARTDIWSLGVVAFEALTGRRPFEGSTIGAITLALHTSKPRITALAPELPPALDAWFDKACAREARARYATARELAQRLAEAVGGAPGSSAVLRAPMESSPSLDGLAPFAGAAGVESGGRRGPDRVVTSLSSSFGVPAPARKKPPVALLAAAGAIVAVLGAIAAVAAVKSAGSDTASAATRAAAAASSTTTSPADDVASPTDAPPSAASADAPGVATVVAPAVSVPAAGAASSASSPPAAAAADTAAPAAAPPKPKPYRHRRRPAKKPNDDDIK